jgi:hypothetical protein
MTCRASVLLLISVSCGMAQPWSGIISPSRAITWGAGLPGTLSGTGETPANPWTPPPRTTICSTLSPGATIAQINSAILACTPGQTVFLNAGTYSYSASSILLSTANNVTLRGAGADQTFLNCTTGCNVAFGGQTIHAGSAPWTAGFAQGATSITIGSVTGQAPTVGTFILLTGNDETFDTGGINTTNLTNVSVGGNSPGPSYQEQAVMVTNVAGSVLTISPGLYMPNWTNLSSLSANWEVNNGIGNGLEDMSINCQGNTSGDCLNIGDAYAMWIKGVRVIAGGANEIVKVNRAKNCLVVNSYFDNAGIIKEAFDLNDVSDMLFWNTIVIGANLYIQSPGEGNVFGYNYLAEGEGSDNSYLNNIIVNHSGGTSFFFYEGNVGGGFFDDFIHGTHNLTSYFRNVVYGGDPPLAKTSQVRAIGEEGYGRFANIIGNVLGSASVSNYISTPSNGVGCPCVADLGIFPFGFAVPADPISATSRMLWGNYDTVNAAVRWNSAEVPSGLNTTVGFTTTLSGSGTGPYTATLANTPCAYGNNQVFTGAQTFGGGVFGTDAASLSGVIVGSGIAGSSTVNCSTGAVSVNFTGTPGGAVTFNYLQQLGSASAFQNALPGSHNLPPSFLSAMPPAAHPSGGTGLSWWKVCTNYPTCNAFYVPPYPAIGPDVTGGDLTAGFGYSIPAQKAWKTLPIDATFQTAYAITASSWAGGVETLTITGLPSAGLVGEFQISSGPCAGTFQVTGYAGSPSTKVTYALAGNPGACGSVNVLWPDVRTFNETVYSLDPINGGGSVIPGGSLILGNSKVSRLERTILDLPNAVN